MSDVEIKDYAGIKQIEVECRWFGSSAATIQLTVFGDCRKVENYIGPIVTNIGRRVDCA
jgi:hypothetical protein